MSRSVSSAALIAAMVITLASCSAPSADESPAAGISSDPPGVVSESPTENGGPAVVEACPDSAAPGELPTAPRGTSTSEDPQAITGPSTAAISDSIQPITRAASPALPVVVESCDGVTVEVTDVSRIVTADLYGTIGEIVYSLGLGDNVVGRDTSMGFTQAADVEVVTPGGHDLNAEAILDLDPTVVLTDASIGPPEVQQQLRDAGISVIFFDDSRTLEGVAGHIRAIAGALGVPAEGDELVDRVAEEIEEALALAPAGDEPLRATFLYIRGTAGVYLMAGPGSGADALIQSIGAVDVGSDIGLEQPFTPLTSEALIAAEPDVIIMMTGGLESVGGVDGLVDIPGIAQTPAGKNKRVVDMDDTDVLTFGPRSGDVIKSLAEAIYQQ